jgi:hypothetical protein
MTSAGAGGGTSPFIADSGMSGADFGEFLYDSDELFGASSPLPILDPSGDVADTLQQLESSVTTDLKSLVSPQPQQSLARINPASAPDSPSGSVEDSSSDDASSSKRTDSSLSSKTALTAGDVMMTDAFDMKSEWSPPSSEAHRDGNQYVMFGSTADGFDGSTFFDFDSASSSPNASGTVATNVASPEMPTIQTSSNHHKGSYASKQRAQGHSKNHSVRSLSSP